MHIVKLASININGISARTRVGILIDYIRRHEFDFVFLQEVTYSETVHLTGYDTYLNIGANMRGTTILARHDFPLNNVIRLPSGRAIAAEYNGTSFINVYAPPGSAKRSDSDQFFNLELPELLYATPPFLLMGEDFNCVLQPVDTTCHFITRCDTIGVVRGLSLTDAWNQDPRRRTFTQHSRHPPQELIVFTYLKTLPSVKPALKYFPPLSLITTLSSCGFPYLKWSRGADGFGGR
jgi:hypothetical protein